MDDLRYKHVEHALADLFKVQPDSMGAFRARIRHFRRLGIPDLPIVGSGTQISWE
jgi:hypothetical protein